jgi:CRP-like cAMP-binding protein
LDQEQVRRRRQGERRAEKTGDDGVSLPGDTAPEFPLLALYDLFGFLYSKITAMQDELLKRFTKSYEPGAVICREGEEGEEMYIIQKGKVRVSKLFADKVHVVSILEKGDFFGETAIVNRTRRTATVTAVDAVELLVFDREGLQNMITRNARIALSIIDKLCRRLQNAHLQIQHLVKRDARGQIALHLRYLFQELPAGQSAVPFQGTLDDISLAFEMPREDVRSLLGVLKEEGILEITEKTITLLDREKLLRLTESLGRDASEAPVG